MRPFHEIARAIGIDEICNTPEPARADPLRLALLGCGLLAFGKTMPEVEIGCERLARELDIKPSVLLAALREVRVASIGQPEAHVGRRLALSGRLAHGSVPFPGVTRKGL